ncbi:MAG: phenylalanine--tRNA ligase subunit beta [Bacilli bacterium]|nr:phenylalanine--tRNA ligase subunit beta [Bacilli bacterium]MBN2877774.1 phenylalanine--tRNA ligase subunit beta [Bacilli bacterium]
MKVSMKWLNEYVDLNQDYKQLEEAFNLKSQEVAGLYRLVDIEGLVIGHVLTCVKHPEADKLSVTTVDVGDEVLQIICGAPNVAAGQKVIVSKVGVTLPGDFKIKKAKIRGIESNGMICSLEELGVKEFDSEETGIYVLGDDAEVGKDPLAYLDLDDTVLDLDLTANRPDLLSMEGVGYDSACMLDLELHTRKHHYPKRKEENNFSVFTDTKDCKAYYAQIIDNVTIKPSPAWLKSRLLAAGVRPINNVVDISNYVMLEYGQPLHAFDYNRIESDQIIVRHAKAGETIQTLDNQKRDLLEYDLVITDGSKPIALAGVMGGYDTEVENDTTKILLESAYFDPTCIRKTSKRLDLKSEASSRFEKGVDPNKIVKAMDYATELFIELAGGEVVGDYSFFDNTQKEPTRIELGLEKLIGTTGHAFTIQEVESILKRLRFDFQRHGDNFEIDVPTRRQNMYGYQDIVEEIVRIYGYDKIPISIPVVPTSGYLTKKQRLRRTVREYFVNNAFNETITYSLVSEAEAIEFDKQSAPVVTIMNPLNKEKGTLRHSLLPSLLNILQYNKARKLDDIFLFELGRAYHENHEIELLSGLMTGIYSSTLWQGKKEVADFYLLKGILESLLAKLHLENHEIKKAENPLPSMHPGMTANLYINGIYIGFLGKLHPQKEMDLGIDKTFVFEFDFDQLAEQYNPNLVMQAIPKYPSVSRDLALVVDRDLPADKLIAEVKVAGKKTLKDVSIFDLYQGEKLDANKKSIALSLVLQNPDKTLESTEVDTVIERILKHLDKTLEAKIR